MASFYGNMKNNSRASFIFDKIYPTRTAMEEALVAKDSEGTVIGDGIFINRYVLIDYHYALADGVINPNKIDEYYTKVDNSIVTIENFRIYYLRNVENNNISYTHPLTFSNNADYYQKKVFIDRFKPDDQISNDELQDSTSSLIETDLYYQHKLKDWENYRASYDSTVWMKIYADNKERYIMVAELDAKAPILEFINDAPSCYNGSGHFDMRASTDLNYIYYLPKNWDMVLNKYSPDQVYNENTNDYWYYQQDKNSNELWFENYILTEDSIAQANKDYFEITYTQVDPAPIGKFISNLHYYELIDNKYIMTSDLIGEENKIYYKMNQPILITGLIVGQDSVQGKYELNNQEKTFDDQVRYPYFNTEGFNKRVSTHVSEKGQGVYFNKVTSLQTYPQHVFKHAGGLTINTYLPNKYFTYIGPKAIVPDNYDDYNRDYAYYISDQNNPETYEFIQLVILDNGKYFPGKPLAAGQAYYYDQDLSNENYFIKSTKWEKNTAYYEITWAVDDEGNKLVKRDDDTYRLDIYLPELGNTVADIYDIIYGSPKIVEDKTDGFNNLIGYCSQQQWQTYNCIGYCSLEEKQSYTASNNGDYGIAANDRFNLTETQLNNLRDEPEPIYTKVNNDIVSGDNYWKYYNKVVINGVDTYKLATRAPNNPDDEYYEKSGWIIPVYLMDGNGDYWAANRIFNLTDEQFNELSPEIYPGLYDIPVYLKEGSNVRPYNNERLKATLAPPYDNLENEDDISFGWSLTLLKRYLSELRYLANGKTNDEEHGIGLQSDWILDDEDSFGYIYHRPNLITNYTPTTDLYALPNKIYYKESIMEQKGEVTYIPLSDYYKRLGQNDYINATNEPLYFENNLYYWNQRTVYKQIDNNNCTEALNLGTIAKISQATNVNAENYLNYYLKEDDTTYIKPTAYNRDLIFYNFSPLEITDYSNWYYQDSEDRIIEITNMNYSNAIGTLYIEDDINGTLQFINSEHKYREFVQNDLVNLNLYCDFDDNNNTPQTLIDNTNVNNVEGHTIYRYANGAYSEFHNEGLYYVQNTIIYIAITNENYDNNRQMYKEQTTNTYVPITAADYIGQYYLVDQDLYTQISAENYVRQRPKFKKVNNVYSELTLLDFANDSHNNYYVYDPSHLDYIQITTTNWENLDSTDDIYLYKEAELNVGDSLITEGYTVYELPRTYSNGLSANKPEYIRCSEYSIYDNSINYYIWDGAQFIRASYTISNEYIDINSVIINHEIEGAVSYDYEYEVIVDENNNISERIYHCYAGTTQDSVGLYHNNQQENNTWLKESVNQFAIHITNTSLNTDAPDIYNTIININTLARADLLTFLNNELINNYGATYEILSSHQNWPTEETSDGDIGFYYARKNIDYHNYDLDEVHFYANPSRYYTLEQVPVEQEDYEIHNIWNSVLLNVMREP